MHAPPADHPALRELVIDAPPQDGRVTVAVRGELDLGATQALEAALSQAVESSVHGVDLDLSDTGFCDCSALNVLIAARRRALDGHKTLVVLSASSAVRRLLTVTGTLSLFAPEDQEPTAVRRPAQPAIDGRPPGQHALNHDEPELRSEVVQLRRAMRTRPVIDQARGILMASFGLSAEDAWSVLVHVSQHTNTKLHRVAEEVVTTLQDGAPSEAIRQHVATAVSALEAASEDEAAPPPPVQTAQE
ncbi:ANTAR domain-containing protein [Streptomyces sp. NPDC006446]|uniref:ANTAR domain-containing protein n=1 Tax=Streptomyces sp. NPDC006446 TaxID=3154301 RepID=UPI0033A24303